MLALFGHGVANVLAWAQPLLVPVFHLWGGPVTWLEIGAFALSLGMVWANMRLWPVAWPLSITASLLYGLLFLDSKLYGEALLQVLFVVLSVWGWWQWLRGRAGDGSALRVTTLANRVRWMFAAATLLLLWPVIALALARWTDSPVPALDALATAGSITGQVLLGRKRLENWAVWLAVNLLSVALFASRSLWLTALLYALFAVLSVVGWRAWARQLAPPSAAATGTSTSTGTGTGTTAAT